MEKKMSLWKWKLRFKSRHARKKNIGLVVGSFDKGGLEQVVLNLYLGYKRKGYNVYIMSQTRNVGQMAEKLLDLRHIYIFDNNREEFLEFCLKKDITILHYHYNTFLMEEAKCIGLQTIYTLHNVYTWMNDSEINERSRELSNANNIVAVSSFVKRYFTARTQTSLDRIQVILNGVDFTELDYTIEKLPIDRKSLKINSDDIVIAEVASFHHVKHQIGMIGVMEDLIKVYPNVKLILIGNIGDANYYQAFEKELENSSAKEHIIVVPYLDHKHMGQFLKEEVDIFTLPTLQEGCSNAVLEAVYCAKPMVLTDVGNAEDIKAESACIVVPPAYDDVLCVTNEDIIKIALSKTNKNTLALVMAFSKMIEEIDEFKTRAQRYAKNAMNLGMDFMVEQYLNIIKK